jgi:hypothetical protein
MVIILIGVALVNSGTKQENATETLPADEVAAD